MITDEEKADIRFYLGYPDVYQQLNPRLESALDVVGNKSYQMTKVRSILLKLKEVEEKMSEYDSILETAGIKRVEEIEFFNDKEAKNKESTLKSEGRRLVNQLSIIFGVPAVNDVFGTSGYQGDSWVNKNFMSCF